MKELLKIKLVRWGLKLLPHVSIVISGMLVVFFCIDRVNTPMGFMTNEFHKVLPLFWRCSLWATLFS